jgi:hypothetical protein
LGVRPLIGRPYIFRNTPLRIRKPAPRWGEDNSYVLRDVLHLAESEIATLYSERITADRPTFEPNVRLDDLEPGLRDGSIKEIDPEYREKLGLGPPQGVSSSAARR